MVEQKLIALVSRGASEMYPNIGKQFSVSAHQEQDGSVSFIVQFKENDLNSAIHLSRGDALSLSDLILVTNAKVIKYHEDNVIEA